MRTVVVLVVWMLALARALATPSEELAEANKAFRNGQFKAAADKYNSLVRPHPQLADSNDLVEAYVNLGVCRVETGDEETAKQEFEQALQIDPNKQLDALVITNKRAIKLFDDTKADLRNRARAEVEKRRDAERAAAIEKVRKSLVGVRENPWYLNWMPFGFGQFQNGDRAKAIFFIGAEVVTAGTSIAIWGYLVNKYGIRNDRVPLAESTTARRLQQIEVGTGIAFIGIYALSVIDSYMHYKRQTRTQLDDELLKQIFPELRNAEPPIKPPAKPQPAKPQSSLHVLPLVTPDGVGIGIGWEN